MKLNLQIAPSLETVLQHRLDLVAERKRIEDEIAQLDDSLGDYLDEMNQEKAQFGNLVLSRVQSSRRTIDKLRLVEQGVLPSVIDAATKETKFSFVKVSKAGDSNGIDASR